MVVIDGEPKVEFVDNYWRGTWSDTYIFVLKKADAARTGHYYTEIEVWYQGQLLTGLGVDLLDPHSRNDRGADLAQYNGCGVSIWADRFHAFYANLMVKLDEQQPPRRAPEASASLLAPPLPTHASIDPARGNGAAPWIELYIAHSTRWSPRAARAYHRGIALWILSAVAASRVCVDFGAPIYPNLFLAMVSRSTLYAKTTTAKIGRRLVCDAGCGSLLAADRSTPQALLKAMAGTIPERYPDMDGDEQQAFAHRLAFAGQRAWYYEEWGSMLHQMARRDSPISDFHGLLRQLDDGEDQSASDTIARELENVRRPYLALLCSATPDDLAPYMQPGNRYWHDGFWPRFTFLTPMPDEVPSKDRQPPGIMPVETRLTTPLQAWHQRLGIPTARIEERMKNKKGTGRYHAVLGALKCQHLALSPEVVDAYYAYNDALIDMIVQGHVASDLDSCYGRFHVKALRVATLLASFQGETTLTMTHWAYAQTTVEEWRTMLHQSIATASAAAASTREEQLEDAVEHTLARYGAMTARELRRHIRGYSSRERVSTLGAMVKAGRITTYPQGRTDLYALMIDASLPEDEETKTGERQTDEVSTGNWQQGL
jgi:hypothetical protein